MINSFELAGCGSSVQQLLLVIVLLHAFGLDAATDGHLYSALTTAGMMEGFEAPQVGERDSSLLPVTHVHKGAAQALTAPVPSDGQYQILLSNNIP